MKSFYPKGNWVKWKSRIEESVESLIKWAFEKTVNKSWQNRWESSFCISIDHDFEPLWAPVHQALKGAFSVESIFIIPICV